MFMMETSTGKIIDDAAAAPGLPAVAQADFPPVQLALQSIVTTRRSAAEAEHHGRLATLALASYRGHP